MTDDELIERLRRTLRAEAEAVRTDRAGAAPRVSPLARPRWAARFGPRLAAGFAVAAAVAAAVLVATTLVPQGRSGSVSVESPTASLHTLPQRFSVPTTQPVTTPTSTPTSTTVSSPAPVRLGSDFVPESVTFVTADDGWVLGVERCNGSPCLTLAQTTDGGATWAVVAAPPVPVTMPTSGSAGSGLQVRFATSLDGWVWGNIGGVAEVWATYDGGAHWSQPAIPGLTGSMVASLETADGQTHVALLQSGSVILDSAPLGGAQWTTALRLSAGAGPVPDATITLQQAAGWLVVDNRVTTGGARLSGGVWSTWRPPCSADAGPVWLAASTAPDVDAVCDAGLFAGPVHNELLVSSDGGTSFQQAGTVPTGVTEIASPAVGTGEIEATFDGGATWRTVYNGPGQAVTQVGFENADQGVAIAGTTSSPAGQLLMTHDGGQTWTAVDLGA